MATHKIDWTNEMIAFIHNSFGKLTARQMADHLKISLGAVRQKYAELGYKAIEMEYWTNEQVSYLKRNFRKRGDVELANIFQQRWPKQKLWTKKHIEKKRNYLGLHRTKGEVSCIRWNNYHLGLMHAPSRFTDNKPVKEGEIKFWKQQSGRAVPKIKINGRFTDWGRWRWEQEHGPIKKGENVIFKGDPTVLELDNLELITNHQMAERMHNKAIGLHDKYIVGILARGNPEIKDALASSQELIELKRKQLQLQRAIKNGKKH